MFEIDQKDDIAARFWPKAKVTKNNDCWPWTAAKNAAGYGVFVLKRGHTAPAHRVAFALEHGTKALKKGLHIAHQCHNRLCVNPGHLQQITAGENIMQSRLAGRTARGTRFKNAKLTDDAVREIRKVAVDIDGEAQMMKKYRVSQGTIQSVFDRKTWNHVLDYP